MAKNFYLDNEDLRFHMEHQDWDELFPLVETDPRIRKRRATYKKPKSYIMNFCNPWRVYRRADRPQSPSLRRTASDLLTAK